MVSVFRINSRDSNSLLDISFVASLIETVYTMTERLVIMLANKSVLIFVFIIFCFSYFIAILTFHLDTSNVFVIFLDTILVIERGTLFRKRSVFRAVGEEKLN